MSKDAFNIHDCRNQKTLSRTIICHISVFNVVFLSTLVARYWYSVLLCLWGHGLQALPALVILHLVVWWHHSLFPHLLEECQVGFQLAPRLRMLLWMPIVRLIVSLTLLELKLICVNGLAHQNWFWVLTTLRNGYNFKHFNLIISVRSRVLLSIMDEDEVEYGPPTPFSYKDLFLRFFCSSEEGASETASDSSSDNSLREASEPSMPSSGITGTIPKVGEKEPEQTVAAINDTAEKLVRYQEPIHPDIMADVRASVPIEKRQMSATRA